MQNISYIGLVCAVLVIAFMAAWLQDQHETIVNLERERDALRARLQDLPPEVQCSCSVRERDSGHRSDCLYASQPFGSTNESIDT